MGKEIICKDTGEVVHSYRAYLKSSHWRNFRLLVLSQYSTPECAHCGIKGITFDIHHKTYDNIGDELLSDVSVLCRDCHNKLHGKGRKRPAKPKAGRRKNKKRKTRSSIDAWSVLSKEQRAEFCAIEPEFEREWIEDKLGALQRHLHEDYRWINRQLSSARKRKETYLCPPPGNRE